MQLVMCYFHKKKLHWARNKQNMTRRLATLPSKYNNDTYEKRKKASIWVKTTTETCGITSSNIEWKNKKAKTHTTQDDTVLWSHFFLNPHPLPSKVNCQATSMFCLIVKINNFIYHLKASFSSRLQVRLDVPWIQIGNAHQKTWSSEGPEFTETEYLNKRTVEYYY